MQQGGVRRGNRIERPMSASGMLSSWVDGILNWLKSLFFKQEMELTLVGLQNSGKTTLVNVIATGGFSEDMIPTVGFNMRKVTKGKVTIKLWDLGGQPRFRSMWERYCRGVNAIVYVVDSADQENIAVSKTELHELLVKPALEGIPLLVLGNKNDLSESLSVDELIERLNLKTIANREVRRSRCPPNDARAGHAPRAPRTAHRPRPRRSAATRSPPRTLSTLTSRSSG